MNVTRPEDASKRHKPRRKPMKKLPKNDMNGKERAELTQVKTLQSQSESFTVAAPASNQGEAMLQLLHTSDPRGLPGQTRASERNITDTTVQQKSQGRRNEVIAINDDHQSPIAVQKDRSKDLRGSKPNRPANSANLGLKGGGDGMEPKKTGLSTEMDIVATLPSKRKPSKSKKHKTVKPLSMQEQGAFAQAQLSGGNSDTDTHAAAQFGETVQAMVAVETQALVQSTVSIAAAIGEGKKGPNRKTRKRGQKLSTVVNGHDTCDAIAREKNDVSNPKAKKITAVSDTCREQNYVAKASKSRDIKNKNQGAKVSSNRSGQLELQVAQECVVTESESIVPEVYRPSDPRFAPPLKEATPTQLTTASSNLATSRLTEPVQHLISAHVGAAADSVSLHKINSNTPAQYSVLLTTNLAPLFDSSRQKLNFTSSTCAPRSHILAQGVERNTVSEPAYPASAWDDLIDGRLSGLSDVIEVSQEFGISRRLSDSSSPTLGTVVSLKESSMPQSNAAVYGPKRTSFLEKLNSGQYGRSPVVARVKPSVFSPPAILSLAVSSPAMPAPTIPAPATPTPAAPKEQTSSKHNTSTDTAHTSKPFFASDDTPTSLHGSVGHAIESTDSTSEHEAPQSPAMIKSLDDISKEAASEQVKECLEREHGDHIVATAPFASTETPMPLLENKSSRNKTMGKQVRTENLYVPPHLRVLNEKSSALKSKTPEPAQVNSKLQTCEALVKVTESKKTSESTRIKAKLKASENLDKATKSKKTPKQTQVEAKLRLSEHLDKIEETKRTFEPAQIKVRLQTSGKLVKVTESRGSIGLPANDTNGVGVQQQKTTQLQKLKHDAVNGAHTTRPNGHKSLGGKDAEEVFVPSPQSHVRNDPVPLSIESMLPIHLRNLPKPVLMGPVIKRNAEMAANQVHLNEKEKAEHVISCNEAFYKPVIDLKARGRLVQELAADEETRGVFLAEDLSSLNSARSDALSIVSARKQAARESKWRWFNKDIEYSESGKVDCPPKQGLHHELADWDGNWQPAPVEWDLRRQFNSTNRTHVKFLELWISERVAEALDSPFKVDTMDEDWKVGRLPASGTRKQWQVFPPDFMWKRVPLEYGPVDWEMVPTLPPNDPFSHTPERKNQCSKTTARKFAEEYYAAKKRRAEDRYARRVELEDYKKMCAERRKLEGPKANIYIRPAQASDVLQITTIYNHYVKNTLQAEELEETEVLEWQARLKNAEDETLAFLVAVLKSSKISGRGNVRGRGEQRGGRRGAGGFPRRPEPTPQVFHETIVGFGYADGISGRNTMFRYTAELQLFVDPNHYRQGIGKTLMDRMMATLDKGYHSNQMTDFEVDRKMAYDVGGSRDVHKIMINIGFHYGQEKEFEWRKKWLEMIWDFDHIGTLNCVGNKFGKGVNMAQMVKETNQVHGVSTWYNEEPHRIPHWEQALMAKAREEREARKEQEARIKQEVLQYEGDEEEEDGQW